MIFKDPQDANEDYGIAKDIDDKRSIYKFTNFIIAAQNATNKLQQKEAFINIRDTVLSLKKISPDIYILNDFADFIKNIEYMYFYNNNIKNIVYSASNYQAKENGFILNHAEANIIFKIYMNDSKIGVNINRNIGKMLRTEIIFTNRNLDNVDDRDYQLLLYVNKILIKDMSNMLINAYLKVSDYKSKELKKLLSDDWECF